MALLFCRQTIVTDYNPAETENSGFKDYRKKSWEKARRDPGSGHAGRVRGLLQHGRKVKHRTPNMNQIRAKIIP